MQFSYDVLSTLETIAHNNTNATVHSFTANAAAVSFEIQSPNGAFPPRFRVSNTSPCGPFCFGEATLLAGESKSLATTVARVTDALVLLPGDHPFSAFLGAAVDFRGEGSFDYFADSHLVDCVPAPGVDCEVPELAPVVLTHTFSGSFDVTYRYCTPGVDLGCPDAIPGFNSPVAAPATLFLPLEFRLRGSRKTIE